MAKVKVEAWQCEFPKCGHIWMAEKEPARCSKCKRKNWNKTGKKKRGKKSIKFKALTTDRKAVVEITEGIVTAVISGELNVIPSQTIAAVVDMPNYGRVQSTAPGWEKPLPLPAEPEPNPNDSVTVVAKPSADRLRELLKKMAAPEQKIGQKCPHGWSNWMQCPKCNKKEDR